MRFTRTSATLSLGLAGALTLSGCGMLGGPEPSEVVNSAQEKLQEQTEQHMVIRLTATEDQVRALMEASDDGDTSSEDAQAAIDLLTQSSLSIAVRSTNGESLENATQPQDMDWALDWSMGEDDLVQLMETGDFEVYLRADLIRLMQSVDPSAVEDVEMMRQQAQLFAQQSPMLAALFTGGWLGLDSTLSQQMLDSVEEQAGADVDALTPEEQQQLRQSMMEHSEVSELEEGKFLSKLRVKEFMEANRELLDKSLEQSSSSSDDEVTVQDMIDSFNDGTFDITYTIDNDEMTRIEFDPLQIAELVEPDEDATQEERDDLQAMRDADLPVSIDLNEQVTDFTVPEDVTEVTEEDLQQLFGAATGTSL